MVGKHPLKDRRRRTGMRSCGRKGWGRGNGWIKEINITDVLSVPLEMVRLK